MRSSTALMEMDTTASMVSCMSLIAMATASAMVDTIMETMWTKHTPGHTLEPILEHTLVLIHILGHIPELTPGHTPVFTVVPTLVLMVVPTLVLTVGHMSVHRVGHTLVETVGHTLVLTVVLTLVLTVGPTLELTVGHTLEHTVGHTLSQSVMKVEEVRVNQYLLLQG